MEIMEDRPMKQKTKPKFRIFKIFLIIIAIVIVIIFALRTINGMRFSLNTEVIGSYAFAGNMDAYPLEQEGMTISAIHDGYTNGFHIIPDEKSKSGLIVSFGGSDGGTDFDRSVMLAKEGYEVVSLFYFGQENQPALYNNVPLEFFGEFLEYAKTANIDTSSLTLSGVSKGAELALLLTNYYDEIDNVVLFAPSSYVFQGGDMPANTSSWTYNDEELPYINLMPNAWGVVKLMSPMIINYPIEYRDFQHDMILKADNADDALIDVSDFKGKILAFAGEDDRTWPADIMGQMIKDLAPEQTELYIYPNAGHVFLPVEYIATGGTVESNTYAQADSDIKLLEFLTKYHK